MFAGSMTLAAGAVAIAAIVLAVGAFLNHARVQRLVPDRMLDDRASFQRNLLTREERQALIAYLGKL